MARSFPFRAAEIRFPKALLLGDDGERLAWDNMEGRERSVVDALKVCANQPDIRVGMSEKRWLELEEI